MSMEEPRRARVLVVDDSAFHRQMLGKILGRHPGFEVIGEAAEGGEAIKEVILKSPDIITLDLEMPGMDGFTFLRWLMHSRPTKTIVISSLESNRSVFKAMELGALDFIVKPVKRDSYRLLEMETTLKEKLAAALRVDLAKVTSRLARQQVRRARSTTPAPPVKWQPTARGIVIASSTGGPPAIQSILQALPTDYPVPIVISQHMPAGFTAMFAKRLAGLSRLQVKEAEDNDTLRPGVYVSPGSNHLVMEKAGGVIRLRVTGARPDDRYIPSADRILLSAASSMGPQSVGVILTGMGDDGIVGLAAVRKAGGLVIAEDESTCVVYGMPRAAAEKGLPQRILPLHGIPAVLIRLGKGL